MLVSFSTNQHATFLYQIRHGRSKRRRKSSLGPGPESCLPRLVSCVTLDTPPSLNWFSIFSSLAWKMIQSIKISEFSAKDHGGFYVDMFTDSTLTVLPAVDTAPPHSSLAHRVPVEGRIIDIASNPSSRCRLELVFVSNLNLWPMCNKYLMTCLNGQRKYWISFPKIRGWGGKTKRRKESVIENSGWASKLRTEYVWEKTSNAWNKNNNQRHS